MLAQGSLLDLDSIGPQKPHFPFLFFYRTPHGPVRPAAWEGTWQNMPWFAFEKESLLSDLQEVISTGCTGFGYLRVKGCVRKIAAHGYCAWSDEDLQT